MASFFMGLLKGLLMLLGILLYGLLGAALSTPYVYLAGWSPDAFQTGVVFAPMALGLLFLLFYMGVGSMRSEGRYRKWRHLVTRNHIFTIPLAWLFLPVICNGLSFLLRAAGMDGVASLVFDLRYASIVIIPVLAIVICGVYWLAGQFIQGAKGK